MCLQGVGFGVSQVYVGSRTVLSFSLFSLIRSSSPRGLGQALVKYRLGVGIGVDHKHLTKPVFLKLFKSRSSKSPFIFSRHDGNHY